MKLNPVRASASDGFVKQKNYDTNGSINQTRLE